MKPYYEQDGITIYHGDCREIAGSLPPIGAVVSDPPYGVSHRRGVGCAALAYMTTAICVVLIVLGLVLVSLKVGQEMARDGLL